MAVKIRLKRMGAKKAPFYRIVVADSRSPRDGKIIETLGTYNPLVTPAEVKVDEETYGWVYGAYVRIFFEDPSLGYSDKEKILKSLETL